VPGFSAASLRLRGYHTPTLAPDRDSSASMKSL
jgi:hypothetical protein